MSYSWDRWGFPAGVDTFAPDGARILQSSQRCGLSGAAVCNEGCGCAGLSKGSYVLSGNYRPLGANLRGYNMEVGRLGAIQAGISSGAQLRGLRGLGSLWDVCQGAGDLISSIGGAFSSADSKSTSRTGSDVQRYADLGSDICGVADAIDDRGGSRTQSADAAVDQARREAGGLPPGGDAPAASSAFDKKNLIIGLVALAAGAGLGFLIAR